MKADARRIAVMGVAQDPRYTGARDAGHRHGALGHASAVIPPAISDDGHRHGANAHDELPDVYRTRSPGPLETCAEVPSSPAPGWVRIASRAGDGRKRWVEEHLNQPPGPAVA
jgi:hypothetical protein